MPKAHTQKAMGKGQLIERLSAQVGSRKQALNILKKRGDVDSSGKLTSKGKTRDNMTAAERAKDRAAKRSGGSPSDYTYNPKTNGTRKKKKKK
jgi:hypothetical protein